METKEIGINTILYTKDGRKSCNCIVIDFDKHSGDVIIATDNGNTINMKPEFINKLYYTHIDGISEEERVFRINRNKFSVHKPRYEGDNIFKTILIEDEMSKKTIKVEEVRSIFINDSGREDAIRTVNSSDIESITYKGNETYDVLYVNGHIERFHRVKSAMIKLVDQEVPPVFN